MYIIIQFAAMLVSFLLVNWLGYNITEQWGLPSWLNYKPFNCRLCLTFWSTVAVAVIYGLFGMAITAIGLAILAVLNAAAMWLNQKNNTVKIEDYEVDK